MSNIISLQEYKNKKNKQASPEPTKLQDVSPEFQARLMRISLMVRSINETMAELAAVNTKKENK